LVGSEMAFASSKYRHTKGSLLSKDSYYTELSPSQTSDANVISVSATKLALVMSHNGGGDVGLLPLEATGKRKETPLQVIHAHGGKQIFDIQFSRLNDEIFGTSADDGLVKVWNTNGDNLATLSGHQRRAEVLRFHPTANGVVASGSVDKTGRLWDIEASKTVFTLNSNGSIEGLSWNPNGSLLASTGGDKTIRVWDPRTEKVVTRGDSHMGAKAQRCVWLGNRNQILSTGVSKFREREMCIWDASNLSSPLKRIPIDSSTGVLIPLFDEDAGIIYLSGKGDACVRSYELLESKNLYKELQSVSCSDGLKCIALAPKRILKVMDCEVNRVFAVLNDAVAPITYVVPRKMKVDFQADLFPETIAPEASISSDEWFKGGNADPKRVSLEPVHFVEKREEKKEEEIKKAEEAKKNEWKPKVLTGIVRSTHYRHTEGKEYWKREHYTNVKADCSTRDATPIAANDQFFAVPWAGPGGRLAVIPHKRVGKLPDTFGMIETGSPVLDFNFHPHSSNLVVTANENSHAYLWKFDDELMNLKDERGRPRNYTDGPFVDFRGHYSKVVFSSFHPTASNVLLTSSMDGTIKFWDANNGKEQFTLSGVLDDVLQSVDWNFDGSLMAYSTHDRKIRLVDPRKAQVIQEASTHTGTQGVKLTWVGDTDRIITTGFGGSAERELGLWDVRKLSSPLAPFTMIDQAQALLQPFYDHDHRILFLAAKGDGTIPYFEVTDEAPHFFYLNKYPTNVPQMGVARLPKKMSDVKKVEICRLFKLTVDSVIPLGFTVPRTRKEFFQDDIYSPTWDEQSVMTSDEWFAGSAKTRNMVDLRPEGMPLLSEAPTIERVAKYKFDPNAPKKETGTSYLGAFYDKMVSVKTGGDAAAQDEKEKQRIDQLNVADEEMEWDDEDWEEAY